jgi:rod shape-determining protein MreC
LVVQLAPIVDVDLDPFRQPLVLDAAAAKARRSASRSSTPHGMMGQLVEVLPNTSVAAAHRSDHAVPVSVNAPACA